MKVIIVPLIINIWLVGLVVLLELNQKNVNKELSGDLKEARHPKLKIFKGQEVEPHSVPYQAFLQMNNSKRKWMCGGVVISTNYLLTSGRCAFGADVVLAILGAHRPMQEEETQLRINCTEIILHEDLNVDMIQNDIALVKFPEPIEFNDFIGPATLPTFDDVDKLYVDEIGRMTGWGLTEVAGEDISEVLNYGEDQISTNEYCQRDFIVEETEICTSGNTHGICGGDFGGPLTVDNVLVGIGSYGIMGCLPGWKSVFTRVTKYLDWIQTNSDVIIL